MTRLDRSFGAAGLIVDRLDREALADGRAVSRQLAAAALGEQAGMPADESS